MALTDSLIAYWKLDETSGNAADAHDSKTLTDHNTVGYDTGKVYTNAREFTASSSEYFDRAADSDLGGGEDFTFAGWFYMNSQAPESPDYYFIVDEAYAYVGWDTLLVDNGNLQFVFRSFNDDTTPNALHHNLSGHAVGEWHFFCAYYDHSEKTIYASIDNDTPNSAVCTDAMDNNWYSGWNVGRSHNGDSYLDGRLQSLCFWNRILTSEERGQLYNSGNGWAYGASVAAPSELMLMGVG
jgi:hypothetical protein